MNEGKMAGYDEIEVCDLELQPNVKNEFSRSAGFERIITHVLNRWSELEVLCRLGSQGQESLGDLAKGY
jgi:hypothetical protein